MLMLYIIYMYIYISFVCTLIFVIGVHVDALYGSCDPSAIDGDAYDTDCDELQASGM